MRRPILTLVPSPPSLPKRAASSPRRGQRAAARLELGAAAILSVVTAVALMPLAEADARRWLEEHGLVHDLAGRRVVIWGDVLEALRSHPPASAPPPSGPARARGPRSAGPPLPRVRLRPV